MQHGHYRPVKRRGGCLSLFVLGALTAGSGVFGLVSLLS